MYENIAIYYYYLFIFYYFFLLWPKGDWSIGRNLILDYYSIINRLFLIELSYIEIEYLNENEISLLYIIYIFIY